MRRAAGKPAISFRFPQGMDEYWYAISPKIHKKARNDLVPHAIIERAVKVLSNEVSIRTGLEDPLITQSIWHIKKRITFC